MNARTRTTLPAPAAQNEVFVCKTAYPPGTKSKVISCSAKHAQAHGYVPCGFTTANYDEALAHVDANEGGSLNCWIESHEHGDLNRPVLRKLHGSDWGGVYVDDFRESA